MYPNGVPKRPCVSIAVFWLEDMRQTAFCLCFVPKLTQAGVVVSPRFEASLFTMFHRPAKDMFGQPTPPGVGRLAACETKVNSRPAYFQDDKQESPFTAEP